MVYKLVVGGAAAMIAGRLIAEMIWWYIHVA